MYGDSTGCCYRMKIRKNTYTELLSRRLGLACAMDYTSGANSEVILQMLSSDEEKIAHLKTAQIVILTVGGNNITVPLLLSMIRALDLGQLGVRTLNRIGTCFKDNPAGASAKVLKELGSEQTRTELEGGVEAFRRQFPLIIQKLREINPDAIILVQTVFNIFYTTTARLYRMIGKPLNKYFDGVNEAIFAHREELGYLVVDLDGAFKAYKGKEDLTTIKQKDIHLTDFGHAFTYRMFYEELVKQYPQYACAEGPDVFRTLETLTPEELAEQQEGDARTKAMLDENKQDKYVQPDDFILGPNDRYNSWFTTEVTGMKFYPLMVLPLEEAALPATAAARDVLLLKLAEDGRVAAFDTAGNRVGMLADEPQSDTRPTVKYALENRFAVFAKLLSVENKEVIFSVHPSYEYYKQQVDRLADS